MTRIFTRWRWGLAVGGIVFGLYIWFAGAEQDPGNAFLHGLIAMFISFILVATDVTQLLASPLLSFIDSVYLPGGHARDARMTYDLPIYYERHFRGAEALDAYEAMIKHEPRQINAYAGAIRVCQEQLGDRSRARYWRATAERMFGYDAVSEAVAKTANEWHQERMQSKLAPAPSR